MKDFVQAHLTYYKGLTTRQKAGVVVGICYLIALLFIEAKGRGDIDIYLKASRDLFSGKNIYEMLYHETTYRGFHYYYDISFAIFIAPFRIFNLYWAGLIWLLINYVFTFRIWKIISGYFPKNNITRQHLLLLAVLSFMFVFSVWHKNLRYGQVTIFILYLCIEGMYQIQHKNAFLGSLLLALGISIKILPLVLLPLLVYRKYFKETAFVLIALVLITFILPIVIFGYDHTLSLLQSRWSLINPLNSVHILDVEERSFHSLTTLLSTLFVENAGNRYSLELKRNIANVNLDTLSLIINLARAFFILLTAFFIRSWPFKKAKSKLQNLYELSYILLIVPLIFPHQQHYAFFFAFPCSAYLMYFILTRYFDKQHPVNRNKRIAVITVFSLLFLVLNSHYLLGNYVVYYDHYKTLTYGIILLIPILAFARPEKLIRTNTDV